MTKIISIVWYLNCRNRVFYDTFLAWKLAPRLQATSVRAIKNWNSRVEKTVAISLLSQTTIIVRKISHDGWHSNFQSVGCINARNFALIYRWDNPSGLHSSQKWVWNRWCEYDKPKQKKNTFQLATVFAMHDRSDCIVLQQRVAVSGVSAVNSVIICH